MTPAEYMAKYRREHPDYAARNRKVGAARTRAMNRLTTLYPDAFRDLYEAECRAAGIARRSVGRPRTQPSEGAGSDPDALVTGHKEASYEHRPYPPPIGFPGQ